MWHQRELQTRLSALSRREEFDMIRRPYWNAG
jgi:hypothetical protein